MEDLSLINCVQERRLAQGPRLHRQREDERQGVGPVLRCRRCPPDDNLQDPGGESADLPLHLQQRLRLHLHRKTFCCLHFMPKH